MRTLNKKHFESIHARGVFIGLVNILNNKIFLEWDNSEGGKEYKNIPFFYSFVGSERFLQDYFNFINDCESQNKISGNFDQLPRGMVKLSNISINTGNMTNKFARMQYYKLENNEWVLNETYVNAIPMQYNFEIIIECNTQGELFKIFQEILKVFYKVQIYNFQYDGFLIPCQVTFPEDMGIERSSEFSFPDSEKNKFTFQLEVETYFPVKDELNEMSVIENRIENIEYFFSEEKTAEIRDIDIITNNNLIYSGKKYNIIWKYTGIIPKVDIDISFDFGKTWKNIAKNIVNIGIYEWKVPFFDANGKIIEDPIKVDIESQTGKDGKFRAIIKEGKLLQLLAISRGYGYKLTDNVSVYCEGENIEYPELLLCIRGELNSIDHANIISRGKNLPNTLEHKILIKVTNSYNKMISNISKIIQKYNCILYDNIDNFKLEILDGDMKFLEIGDTIKFPNILKGLKILEKNNNFVFVSKNLEINNLPLETNIIFEEKNRFFDLM